jgi:3-hydroxyisobutyrate dehydrogenase-like beta-hydroxyacid dehydrogenase
MSTLDPGHIRQLSISLATAGGSLVDAPSGGGAPAALKGELALFVAGTEERLAPLSNVLDALGTVTVIGPEPGMAQAAKLLTQLALAVNLVGVREAVRLGEGLGLPSELLVPAIVRSSGNSFVASNWDFLCEFMTEPRVDNVGKDLDLLQSAPGVIRDDSPLTQVAAAALRVDWPIHAK